MYALYYNAREIDPPVAEFFHPVDFLAILVLRFILICQTCVARA